MPDPAAAPATPTQLNLDPAAGGAKADPTPTAAPAAGGEPQPGSDAPEPAKPAVPEKYDLKLPEGSPLDPSRMEEIAALAKERGLSNEAAQELLNGEHAALDKYVSKQTEALVQKDQAWVAQLQADPDFGRDKFAENVEHAKRFLQKFGDPELMEQLEKSRLGNFPPLVKALSRAGRAMAPDQIVNASSSGGEKKSLEARLYADDANK